MEQNLRDPVKQGMKTKFLSYGFVGLAILSVGLLWHLNGHAGSLPSGNMRNVVAGNTEFACDLYGQLRTQEGNLFLSPYSISTALAMTYGGARGETATQMAQTLHFDLPESELPAAFGEMEDDINDIQSGGRVQLAVANSLWPQKDYTFQSDFLKLCKKYYGASIHPVDYINDTEGARQTINGWVEKKTNDKIVNLLAPGSLDPSNRLVLVNAIYFQGKWEKRFEVRDTSDGPFYESSNQTSTASFMQQTEDFGYAEFPDLQVLELPYTGGEVSMVVLLPGNAGGIGEFEQQMPPPGNVDSIGKLEEQLTAPNLVKWTTQLHKQKVQVFLPTFKVTSEFSLGDTLGAMGMPDAFIFGQADFSGMNGKQDLFISKVVHKAYVDVDEEGTEAAAATAVVMTLAAAMPAMPVVFRADHPFLFLIRDNETGSILFLGRVTDPTR
jgi:serpin B